MNTSKELFCRVVLTTDQLPQDTKTTFIIQMIFNIFISTTATLGNLLVLVAIWRSSNLRSPSITLLFGLALSDMFVGLIAEPLYIGLKVELFKNSNNLRSCTLLYLTCISSAILTEATLLTVTAISVDRYMAIYLHLRYEQVVSEKRTRILILCLWIACGLHSMILIVYKVLVVHFIIMGSVITICLIAVSFVWIKIYQVVRHHQAQIQDQFHSQGAQQFYIARFRKSAINSMIILLIFLVCYLPNLISLILLAYKVTSTFRKFAEFAYLFIVLNSMLNPLLYCWRNHDIRVAVKETLMKCAVVL